MNIRLALAAIASLAMFSASASAVVVEQRVTPAYLKENPKAFTVEVKKRDDGLVHFTVTRKLLQPRYLVGHLRVRLGSTTVLTGDFPSYSDEGDVTYHFAVLPEHVADSEFQIAERSFGVASGGQKVPLPGGTDYKIRLSDFATEEVRKAPPEK